MGILKQKAQTGKAGFGQKCPTCYHRHKSSQPQETQWANGNHPGPEPVPGKPEHIEGLKIKEGLKFRHMEKKKKRKLGGDLTAVPTAATVAKNKQTNNRVNVFQVSLRLEK